MMIYLALTILYVMIHAATQMDSGTRRHDPFQKTMHAHSCWFRRQKVQLCLKHVGNLKYPQNNRVSLLGEASPRQPPVKGTLLRCPGGAWLSKRSPAKNTCHLSKCKSGRTTLENGQWWMIDTRWCPSSLAKLA